MFDIDLAPAGSVELAIVAAVSIAACVVSFVLDFRAAARVRRCAGRGACACARAPAVDEADEARAYEWLTSGSGQYQPMPTPNSDSRA